MQTVKEEFDDCEDYENNNHIKRRKHESSSSDSTLDMFLRELREERNALPKPVPMTSTPSSSGSKPEDVYEFFDRRLNEAKRRLDFGSDSEEEAISNNDPDEAPGAAADDSVLIIEPPVKNEAPSSPFSISTASITDLMDKEKWEMSPGSSSSHLHSMFVKVPAYSAQQRHQPMNPTSEEKNRFKSFLLKPEHKVLRDFCLKEEEAAVSLLHVMDYVSQKTLGLENPLSFNGWLFEGAKREDNS